MPGNKLINKTLQVQPYNFAWKARMTSDEPFIIIPLFIAQTIFSSVVDSLVVTQQQDICLNFVSSVCYGTTQILNLVNSQT